VALGVSAFVKLITLPLAAVYWLSELRSRGARALATTTLLFGLTAVGLYAPFWHGLDLLTIQMRLLGSAPADGPDLFRLVVYAGFAAAVLCVGLSRDGRIEHMLRGWALLMLLFALFLSRPAFSWYLITLIAVAGLAVEWRLALITILLSSVSFLMNAWDTASNETFQLPVLLALPRFPTYLLIICAVALGMAALEVGRRARQRQRSEYRLEQP
jgi:hypothetical protein